MPRQSQRAQAAKKETGVASATKLDSKAKQSQRASNSTRTSKRKAEVLAEEEDDELESDIEEEEEEEEVKPSKKRKTSGIVSPKAKKSSSNGAKIARASKPKVKAQDIEEEEAKQDDDGEEEKKEAKLTKKPKAAAKNGKESTEQPLAARTEISKLGKAMYIGAHVSSAGGVQNSVANAVHIGANSFALFLKSQRKWTNPPIAPASAEGFLAEAKTHALDIAHHCMPHGSYLVNLAAEEKAKADQAYSSFLDDLQRCEKLGIRLYNFHPGNTNGKPRKEALARIADKLNKAHKETTTVITLLENMAGQGQGNVVGSSFEDLRDIIADVDDKSRVGVCLDTCHAFAAGYDLRSPESFQETMAEFERIVGISYLKGLHLNDSKAPLASHRDLHANIGTGVLGLRAFHNVMNHVAFEGLPMVLETPIDQKDEKTGKSVEDKTIWAKEIKLLEQLVGMDVEGEEFKKLEAELWKQGTAERKKVADQVERKKEKDANKGKKGRKKGKASQYETDEEED